MSPGSKSHVEQRSETQPLDGGGERPFAVIPVFL